MSHAPRPLLPFLVGPLCGALLLGASLLPSAAAPGGAQERDGEDDLARQKQLEPPPGHVASRPLATDRVIAGEPAHPRSRPRLIVDADRGPHLLCTAWRDGVLDQLEWHAIGDDADAAHPLLPAPVELLDPAAVVDARGRRLVAFTQRVDGVPRIVVQVSERSADAAVGPAPRLATTTGRAEGRAALALHRERVWMAWECEPAADAIAADRPARRQLLLAPLDRAGIAGEPQVVGDGVGADREPALASGPDALWIAWSRCDGDDRDIVARRFDPERRAFDPPIAVSADPAADDRHVVLAIAADGTPWFAWDRSEIPHRGNPVPSELAVRPFAERLAVSIRTACIAESRVLVPKSNAAAVPDGMVAGAALLSTGGGLPQLAFDRGGALWIAYRALEVQVLPTGASAYGFPVLLHHLGAEGWSPPLELAGSAGPDEAPALATAGEGDGVVVAAQVDQRLSRAAARSWREPAALLQAAAAPRAVSFRWWFGPPGIALARASASRVTPPPLVPAPTATIGAARRFPGAAASPDARINGAARFEIARGDERYAAWYGDLHRHTHISRCTRGAEPGAADRHDDARDLFACDFVALTDHDGVLDPLGWWQLDRLQWANEAPSFVPLAGYEWSTRTFGHVNVIRRGRNDLPAAGDRGFATLRRALDPAESLVIPHHSADGAFPSDFSVLDDEVTRLIEVHQAWRGSFEFDGCFLQSPRATTAGCFVHDALAAGHLWGIIASTDHGWGASYAGVLAPRLDRDALFAAFRARRTFGATTRGLFIDFRAGGALMGEEVAIAGAVELALTVHGTAPLADVAIFRDGERRFAATPLAPLPCHRLAPSLLHLELLERPRSSAPPVLEITTSAPDAAFSAVEARAGAPPASRFRVDPGDPRSARLLPATDDAASRATLRWWCVGDAPLALATPGGGPLASGRELRFAALLAQPFEGALADGTRFRLRVELRDAAIDLTRDTGSAEFHGTWRDDAPRDAVSWYYARAIQADGEVVWSSPIFVRRE